MLGNVILPAAGAFQLVGSDDSKGVQRVSDAATIPPDPDNRDWQVYLAWRAAGNTALAAPQPEPQTSISALTFFSRFTPAEEIAVQAACSSNPQLGAGLTHGLASGTIDLTDAAVSSWLDGLIAAGAIAAARKAVLLQPA